MSEPEFGNTGRGVHQWMGLAAEPAGWPTIDTYERDYLDWRILEPSQGSYNLSRVETVLAAAAAKGGRAGFRVMPFLPGQAARVPSYVPKQAGGQPDWNSSTFLTGYINLMQAIAAAYDQDPRLWFVDYGGYGSWGEWGDEQVGTPITTANGQALIRGVSDAFTSTWTMIPWFDPWPEYAFGYSPRAGLRMDAVGKMDMTTQYMSAAFQARWETVPVVGEHYPTAPDWTAARMLQNVQALHIATLSSRNYPAPYATLTGADKATFETAQKTAGYRYRMVAFSLPPALQTGQAITVHSEWANDGVAPTHDQWTVRLVLTAGNGAEWTAPLTGVDLRASTGGGAVTVTDSTVTLAGLASGYYDVAVRVTHPYLAPMRLAIQGRDATGAYRVGRCWIG